ncbi:MAG: hypothetical protein ABJZ91_07120, partial [Cyclobacteriaceae bacterium]
MIWNSSVQWNNYLLIKPDNNHFPSSSNFNKFASQKTKTMSEAITCPSCQSPYGYPSDNLMM